MKIAKRAQGLAPSGIRRIDDRAERLRHEGRDIIQLTIGRPDFDTPRHIKEAAKAALDAGNVHYTSNRGTLELRRAISEKLLRENRITADPETEVLVTTGAIQAMAVVFQALLDPGDEVLLPTPGYSNYAGMAKLHGAQVIPVRLRSEDGFALDPNAVLSSVGPRARMLVLITPNNPTGAVWPERVLQEVAQLAADRDLIVVSDEIYEKQVYNGNRHCSIATLPGMRERTITINSFSKAYSMTGWRLGYVVAPASVVDAMVPLVQHSTVCPTSFAQAGAIAALRGSQEPIEDMRLELDRRRRLVSDMLERMPGVHLTPLQGAFYAFPKVDGHDDQLADRLLEEAGVATVPGSAFGQAGVGHLRLSYAVDYDRLREGLERLGSWLDQTRAGHPFLD
jgi:aspartate/methionine/tyrosine aminotransferase